MVRHLFVIFNLLCISLLAYFGVQFFYAGLISSPAAIRDKGTETQIARDQQKALKQQGLLKESRMIVRRNLFKVLPEKSLEKKSRTNAGRVQNENTFNVPPSFELVGTVTGGEQVYAVIEDKKTRKQSLYRAGEEIDSVTLEQVEKDHVVLVKNGQKIRLEMSEPKAGTSRPALPQLGKTSFPPHPVPTEKAPVAVEIPLDEAFIEEALSDFEQVKKQVRYRTYHKGGEKKGILLYGIRPESVFKAMGFRNGDILQQVNETQVENIEDAVNALNYLDDNSSATVSFIRGGQSRQIVFKLGSAQDE